MRQLQKEKAHVHNTVKVLTGLSAALTMLAGKILIDYIVARTVDPDNKEYQAALTAESSYALGMGVLASSVGIFKAVKRYVKPDLLAIENDIENQQEGAELKTFALE